MRMANWMSILLIMTTLTSTYLLAKDPKPCSPAGLSLSASAGKSTYAMYEPVLLTYSVRNRMDCRVETSLYIDRDLGVQLLIEDEQGKQTPYIDGMSSDLIMTKNRVFEPGDVDTGQHTLFYNDAARQLAFPHPGRYKIIVRGHVWNDPRPVLIESFPVLLNVRQVLDQDRQAIESLGSEDRLVTLFRDGIKRFCADRTPENCGDDLRLFLRRHFDSAYAPVAALYLGQAVADGILPDGTEGEDLDALLNRFLKTWPSHPFESVAMRMMVEESQRHGKRDEAMERLHEFDQKYPEHVTELRELRAKVERTP
jgi:hypothetical protein